MGSRVTIDMCFASRTSFSTGIAPRCPSFLADHSTNRRPGPESRGVSSFLASDPGATERDPMTAITAGQDASDTAGVDAISTLRGQIDALDEAIVRLVAERARLSRRIQTARVNAGGTRVELGRERVILDAYRGGLGPQGANLADAILQVCRGTR
jgi:chorismate mutase